MPEESQLIDVAKTFPTLHIDLKYATADNITGRPIYQHAACLLHTDAATALAKAIGIAALAGLKLVVYDAYRPQQAQ
ncbi:M15 family metallopeptidase, partial [Enterobacter hormaechei]